MEFNDQESLSGGSTTEVDEEEIQSVAQEYVDHMHARLGAAADLNRACFYAQDFLLWYLKRNRKSLPSLLPNGDAYEGKKTQTRRRPLPDAGSGQASDETEGQDSAAAEMRVRDLSQGLDAPVSWPKEDKLIADSGSTKVEGTPEQQYGLHARDKHIETLQERISELENRLTCNHTFHRLGGFDDCPDCNPKERIQELEKKLETEQENVRFYRREWESACERDRYGKEQGQELERERDELQGKLNFAHGECGRWRIHFDKIVQERDELREKLTMMTRFRDELKDNIEGPGGAMELIDELRYLLNRIHENVMPGECDSIDSLRSIIRERDELSTSREHWRLECMRLDGENAELHEKLAAVEEALEKIAKNHCAHPGDLKQYRVELAREALAKIRGEK